MILSFSWIIGIIGCATTTSTDTTATTAEGATTTTNAGGGTATTSTTTTTINHSNATWETSTLHEANAAGQFCSMAIDSSNNLHIAYRRQITSGNEQLMYMTNASGSWVSEEASATEPDHYTAIAVDSSGGVHIAYYGGSSDLIYATKASGGSWSSTTIDSTGTVGQYAAIALDSSGKVYISYVDVDDSYSVNVATNKSGSWVLEEVEATGTTADTSIAVDSSGTIHLAYSNLAGNLIYSYKTSSASSWTKETVDSTNSSMRFASLALDSAGTPHIAYINGAGGDGSDGQLQYTSRTGSNAWSTPDAIADHLRSGEYASLDFDSNNHPFIAYHTYATSATYLGSSLKIAFNVASSWEIKTIESGGNSDDQQIGTYCSLVLDSANRAHVAYFIEYGSDLKYAVEQ